MIICNLRSIMEKRNKIKLLFLLFSILLTEESFARMSGAGAGLLGGGIGFLAGSMVTNAANRRRERSSYYDEPQVVYTTIDRRPINNHYYYNKNSANQRSEYNDTDDYDNIDSQIDDADDYEYKVVKIKKK